MIIGANVSSAGGVLKALPRAQALGVEAMQFFASSPRSFTRRVIPDENAAGFREGFRVGGFHSLWIHGSYLMNFATASPDALKRSIASLIADLGDCVRLGGKGVIFHLGSHGGRGLAEVTEQIVRSLNEVVAETPAETLVILENSAGMGGSIGSKFEELALIVSRLPKERVKVCLDTQHAFAAGYPIYTEQGLAKTLTEFDHRIGLDRLVVLHCNDSKIPFGGGVDRHENIGDGLIGRDGLKGIVQHPKLQGLPFLLEVPGLDHSGPDKDNVDRLKALTEPN